MLQIFIFHQLSNHKARVFVPIKPFEPSLIFVSKAEGKLRFHWREKKFFNIPEHLQLDQLVQLIQFPPGIKQALGFNTFQ